MEPRNLKVFEITRTLKIASSLLAVLSLTLLSIYLNTDSSNWLVAIGGVGVAVGTYLVTYRDVAFLPSEEDIGWLENEIQTEQIRQALSSYGARKSRDISFGFSYIVVGTLIGAFGFVA